MPTNSPVAATKCLRKVDVSSADLGVAKPNIGLLRPWLTCRLIDDMTDRKSYDTRENRGWYRSKDKRQMKAKGSSSTQDGPALTVIYYILPSLLKKQRSDVQQTARVTKGWEASTQGGGTKQKAHAMQAVPRRRIDQ